MNIPQRINMLKGNKKAFDKGLVSLYNEIDSYLIKESDIGTIKSSSENNRQSIKQELIRTIQKLNDIDMNYLLYLLKYIDRKK